MTIHTLTIFSPKGGKEAPPANIYVVRTSAGTVLIDTAYKDAGIEDQIRNLGINSLDGILITHLHIDHIGGLQEVHQAFGGEIYLPEKDIPVLQSSLRVKDYHSVDNMESVEIGSLSLKVIFTPGHTPGHVCYLLEEERALFSGDLVVGEGTTWVGPPHGNIAQYFDSLKKLRGLDLHRIYSGHGPIIDDPGAKVEEFIEHRLMRERQVIQQLEQGKGQIPEMVKGIYEDLEPHLELLAQITVLGHLEKLIKDGVVELTEIDDSQGYRLIPEHKP